MKRKKRKKKRIFKRVDYNTRLNDLKKIYKEGVSLDSDKIPEITGVTKPNEFSFLDGTILAQGIPYHVMFESDTKTEFYMTGEKHMSDSEFIVRIKGETSFGQYKRLKGVLTSQLYFTPYDFVPLKKDFKRGFSYRFFGRKRFGDKSLIEISEVDYKKNSVMYTTTETRWYVGDDKNNIQVKNSQIIEELVNKGLVELESMNVMEGYTGPDDDLPSLESLKQVASSYNIGKKKKKIKKSSKKKRRGRTQSQSTQSSNSQAPSSGGGGGAY